MLFSIFYEGAKQKLKEWNYYIAFNIENYKHK